MVTLYQFGINLRNRFRVILLILLCGFAFSFLMDIRPILFFIVFCMSNALFLTYERYVEIPMDVELSTFLSILMTLKYGLVWGILTAIFSKIASMLYNRDFNRNSIFSMMGYILAAVFAHLLHGLNILHIGIIVTLLVNLYYFIIYRFVVFLSQYEAFMYNTTNIIFNLVLFIGFSDLILKIMI